MWRIWRQIHPFSPPISVTVSAHFCCKTRIYMVCRTRLLLERICHPIRYSVAICLRICLIRPKGPFISQGLLDIVSAYVSAFSSCICLCIRHLPRTTGRTLSYLPSYLSPTTGDWQNTLFACPFTVLTEHCSLSSLSPTVQQY
jgi:hypothetical protein